MNTAVNTAELIAAIELQHGGKASFVQSVPVFQSFEGQKAWEGMVHVFDLTGHPTAKRAYAWSAAIDGSTKRRYYAVLQQPPINSPQDAVRAAIVHEYREGKI